MVFELKELLKHKAINGWGLFLLIAAPMSAVILVETLTADLSTGPGVSKMIVYSVRFAVPFIFVVVAISSLQYLFPGAVPAWMLRNRKYIGMCFAVAMAWQGLFIFMMSNIHRDYYFDEVYLFRDELEGTTGYIFLAAMVVTSFRFARRFLHQRQWRLLHISALYFLWAYPFSVYWWNIAYYPDPQAIDYVFYWIGFSAFTLRIVAWGRRRQRAARKLVPGNTTPLAFRSLGGVIIAAGLVLASAGLQWQHAMTTFLTTPAWSANLELWLPFWPFEPFLSIFIIGLGTMLATRARAQADDKDLAVGGAD